MDAAANCTTTLDKRMSIDAAAVGYFRTQGLFNLELLGELSDQPTYFCMSPGETCFGRLCTEVSANEQDGLWQKVTRDGGKYRVPFDPTEVADNLRRETYATSSNANRTQLRRLASYVYYSMRPFLPVSARKHLQRMSLSGWDKKKFPSWPVDRTVDRIMEKLMWFAAKASPEGRVPFVWFWPEGKRGCTVMTHDVETSTGLKFCSTVMDLNDSFGIKSSFQLIPAARYAVQQGVLNEMRDRSFEINVHDWNHDGLLFEDRVTFLARVAQINRVAGAWGADGFRSAVLYRNLEWLGSLSIAYDMSVPNVGHLDPQWGGCCTVMPYFVDDILEIPLTTIQDYSLFHILGDYSIDLWKRQVCLILENYGIASFNVHPDYIRDRRARAVYVDLLSYLSELRAEKDVWIARPSEVNRWWRDRSNMRVVPDGSEWRIEGARSERARIAFAIADGNSLRYSLP